MKEEAAEVGGRGEQADAFDVALPTQKRCSSQGCMFGAVIGVFDPGRESGVEFCQGQGLFGIEVGQELVPSCISRRLATATIPTLRAFLPPLSNRTINHWVSSLLG